MTAKFQELVAKLKEIFQLDKPELDFGLYRIMHAKSAEVTDFLEHRLEEKMREALSGNEEAEKQALQQELGTLSATLQQAGIDPETSPKVKELRDRIAAVGDGVGQAESEVYSHLLTFFGRYYDQGDFISKRRYNGDKYAIPYAGEEVKLHWANADQYYIKSGENFTNYDFTLADGARVHFKLVAAATAKDNVKDADAERRFVLWRPEENPAEAGEEAELLPSDCCEEKDGELFIYFQYRKCKKGTKQAALIEEAEKLALERLAQLRLAVKYPLAVAAPTEKDKNRSLLKKHLERYTAKNTSDYFIHKDLQGFLTRELDFYIKNEMLHLDDLRDAAGVRHIERQLRQIRTVRAIAGELIAFMAQLENFQKRLWLKKKFVTRCEWCVTMDRLPEDLRAEALANPRQQEEWRKLGFAETGGGQQTRLPGTETALDARMVDTKFFDESFKARLLRAIPDIDEQCDGVLIHSENFQALNLLQERYREQIKCIYIDPFYNTGNDGFLYKDSYKTSSWASSISCSLKLAYSMMSDDSLIFVSNDDNENENLKKIIKMNGCIVKTNLIWNTDGHTDNQFEIKVTHEYITVAQKSPCADYGNVIDPNTRQESNLWKNIAENSITKNGPANPFTEIILPIGFPVASESGTIESNMPANEFFLELGTQSYFPRNLIKKYSVTFPIRYNSATYRNFKLCEEIKVVAGWANLNKLKKFIKNGCIPFDDDTGEMQFYLSENGTIYYKKIKYAARNIVSVLRNFMTTEKMKYELESMGIEFSYPKPKDLISYILTIGNSLQYLDYFAGSGTTAHAVIDLNRADKDGGKRKYILVEMGEHFDTVLKPRIEKVVYSPDWKDGKPTSADKGISHCFKYMTLESYEDALGNIEPADRGTTLPGLLRDEYLLHYMLDLDVRASLINTDSFKHPFDYCLKMAVDAGGATEKRKIDLIETFNYLIGLTVQGQDRYIDKGYVFVEGKLPNGDTALVIWRDVDKVDNAALNRLLAMQYVNPGNQKYAVIYVNGDHAIPNRKLGAAEGEPELKIRQLETVFLQKMFEEA